MTYMNITLRKISNGFILSYAATETFVADASAVAAEVTHIVENYDATAETMKRMAVEAQQKAAQDRLQSGIAWGHAQAGLQHQTGLFGIGQNSQTDNGYNR